MMTMAQNILENPERLPEALRRVIRDRCRGDKKVVEAVFMSLLLEALQVDTAFFASATYPRNHFLKKRISELRATLHGTFGDGPIAHNNVNCGTLNPACTEAITTKVCFRVTNELSSDLGGNLLE